MAGAVRARRDDRKIDIGKKFAGSRMRWHADRDRIEARPRKFADRRAAARLHDDRKRPRPEFLGKRQRIFGKRAEPFSGGKIGHMRDQRIERRASLCGIKCRHRARVAGSGPEAVDRLGREGHESTGTKHIRGACDCRSVRSQDSHLSVCPVAAHVDGSGGLGHCNSPRGAGMASGRAKLKRRL